MIWILILVAAVVVGAGVAMGVALASRSRRDYAARLEVVPGVATDAPTEWAGAHTPEARLHRRLGDAVRAMRDQPHLGGPTFVAQRSALEEEAIRIDRRLISLSKLRGGEVDDVAPLVDDFETAVTELVTAALDDPTTHAQVLRESEIRLQALEAARAEVERIDREQRGDTAGT